MKTLLFSLVLLAFPWPSFANGELTGDTRLSCEALLCLSSGVRPGECGPSLSRYFGIQKKKWSDTLNARKSFLRQCPASNEPGMPNLVDTLTTAAGQCSASVLNRVLAQQVVIEVCEDNPRWGYGSEEPAQICYEKVITVISSNLPGYCAAYAAHEWTWKVGVTYIGQPMKGGHWIDEQ